jgi:hypothetical protein
MRQIDDLLNIEPVLNRQGLGQETHLSGQFDELRDLVSKAVLLADNDTDRKRRFEVNDRDGPVAGGCHS